MTLRIRLLPSILVMVAATCAAGVMAQSVLLTDDIEEARQSLEAARQAGEVARKRAEQLERKAKVATEQAERTARQSAALAARIQETQAEIASREARIEIIDAQRRALQASLAEKQEPLIGLTAALQRISRRPPVLSLLRPGSLRDAVYMRAMLQTMMPEVERRTAGLRAELDRAQQLEQNAIAAANDLRQSQARLKQRRNSLVSIETRERLESRQAASVASREAERALALAEKARDLTGLVEEIGKQGELRARLAALPGPILRPQRPEDSRVDEVSEAEGEDYAPFGYILPVQGRIVAGFGDEVDGRPRSRGIVLAARRGAQAVAPAAGRVAYAGAYRGFGRIVIVEHAGGWTTLVTGLAKLDVRVGENLVEGAPIGLAGQTDPIVTVELRREGDPVNPLMYIGDS